ncbi:MAG: TetR/AcrR family transcriptional regulator [Promethearchaeota archaeon]
MSPKYKVTRARSEEKKEDKFEDIIQAGTELFLKKGTEGFSMRNLAEKLGMTKNNLYNYVSSKRELWIAIRNKFYSQFKIENQGIIDNFEGSYKELLIELFKHFNEFAQKDFGVFLMMFDVTNAPPSNNIGKIEGTYKEFRLLDGTTHLIKKAIDNKEIKVKNPALAALFLYSLLFGANYSDMNRKEGNKVLENVQLSINDISSEDFQSYVIDIIDKLFSLDLL